VTPLSQEDELIAWLRRRLARAPGGDLAGDDAALLPARPASAAWAATVDSQIAGVHAPPGLDPAVLARRLLAVNLSDLAAVGAAPAYALAALAAPPGYDRRRFLGALVAACARAGVTLAGGDLVRAEVPAATLTLFGSRPAGGAWLRRSAARAGHRLWLGGTVGESAAGRHLLARGARLAGRRVDLPAAPPLAGSLAAAARRAVRRHLAPAPQLALGRALGRLAARRRGGVGGVIDVSDGLALDLARLCRASGVGAEVEVERLPAAPRFHGLAAAIDRDPLELALGGGEDYVLLFTLDPRLAPPAEFRCRRIGAVTAGRRLTMIDRRGRRPLPVVGWDHLDPAGGE
jgi:thiamine-monophosphate kinase